ncbi:MAG: aminotransferase class V-fold PLP-dependent enzyme [Gammaproteobacteria bacterium]|nr:MAG: aminotransferase class V-fold PLP-dependent enzyme [Gammaproteobacteria bacterium]
MTRPSRPQLAPADDLTAAADIDISAAIAPLIGQRYRSPIVRPSSAADVAALIDTSFPHEGEPLQHLVAQIENAFEQYPRRNTHPGFFGWIAPSGLPSDPLAHAMVAALNENLGTYWASPVGTMIEKTVIRWLAELTGLPPRSEGVFTSGGSLSNLAGIASAIARRYGRDYRERGLYRLARDDKPVVLCSAAAHFSVRTAVALLGLGTDSLVAIDTDEHFRMSTENLAETLKQQQNVLCVVATAGTTNTGAIDPLEDIAALCKQHDVWLHVDAAYGGGGLMSEDLRPRYRGIEKADSVVMDMHKWFFQSLGGSLLLYRDPHWARQIFYETSDYLTTSETPTPEQHAAFHFAPELSRRFRALPFYIALRCYGLARLGRNALHNVQCAEYLAELIRQHEDLELVVAPQLAILCFRYRPAGYDETEVDRINAAIRDRIQLDGDYLMSATRVHDRPVLRVCIINHATRAEHVEGLLDNVLRIGRSLV